MSYLVCHMKKVKAVGVKGIQFHNQRERESKTNPDIEKEKSHLNYDLHNQQNINYNEKVKNIISENIITDRAIRKDAVVISSFIVTSDKGFFDGISDLAQHNFFKESYNFLGKRYGENNIVYASVHLDEKTPHMHMGIVPATEDNRLSAKSIFTRKELVSLQDDFHKYITDKGFNLERGVSSDREHMETKEFKAKTLDSKVNDLELEYNSLQKDLKAIKNDLSKYDDVDIDLDHINRLEGKQGLLNKQKIVLDTDDFEYLKTVAKKQLTLESKFGLLERENKNLKHDFEKAYDFYQKNKKQVPSLKKEIKVQEDKLDIFNDFIKDNNLAIKLNDFLEERKKEIMKQKAIQKSWDLEI